MQADGQTHMTKLIVAFRNFANAPKDTHVIFMRMSNTPAVVQLMC
jgi:hypothetical protein